MGKQHRNHNELLRARSRELRRPRNMAEAVLWQQLRGRRFAEFQFRRQHVIGPYVVDFYCAAAQLVVELDGLTHRGREAEDRARQDWLEARGIRVLRCGNHELYENLEGLLELIWQACRSRIVGKK